MIRLNKVSKVYPARAKGSDSDAVIRALDDISLNVEAGEWVAIMGPSGSGKSTLVNLIGCLDRPSTGEVWLDGEDVAQVSPSDLNRVRAEKIGFIFQQFHMIPYLTAVENVMLAQYFHSMTDEQQALEALERVGLRERAHHLPAQLSGGEQQRVCIARALINDPKIILADEPTGNLDAANEEIVLRILRELHDQGRTIVMVTHDPVMARLADRRIELHHGRVASQEVFAINDEFQFEEMLEEIWIITEEHGEPADVARLSSSGALPSSLAVERMAEMGLLTLRPHTGAAHEHHATDECHRQLRSSAEKPAHGNTVVEFTPRGRQRAADLVRRHRLAEVMLAHSLGMKNDAEITEQACKFEHVLSPEATEKICEFLGHPPSCPHGSPIPAGRCCAEAGRALERELVNLTEIH